MKRLAELELKPGDLVFVDGVEEGVARLLIGEDGERLETIPADDLPPNEEWTGNYFRIGSDGDLTYDPDLNRTLHHEIVDLMDEVFGDNE